MDTKNEIKSEIKNEINSEIKNEIKSEIENEINSEIKNEIENEKNSEILFDNIENNLEKESDIQIINKCQDLEFPENYIIPSNQRNMQIRTITLTNLKNNRSIRTNKPVKGSFYFEVIILKNYVRVGICYNNFDILSPCGTGNSFSYGSKFGYKYHSGIRNFYSERFGENDIISIFRNKNNQLIFFKNGKNCGIAYENVDQLAYPCVSFFDGVVDVNLGPCFAYFDKVMKYESE